MSAFFITGTDTNVGKTWFTCWLVRAWLAQGHTAVGLKPIATGDRDDAVKLQAASRHALTFDEINPVHFQKPASPLAAARAEIRAIDFAALNKSVATLRGRFSHLAVEGVGGWRVPLGPKYDVSDWARDLDLPVVVVARGTLGTLNHTRLTVESVFDAGLACAGVVVNFGAPASGGLPDLNVSRLENVLLLRELLTVPVLEFDRGVEASGDLPAWLR